MNYYQFHIGDYASHTAHLSPIEDLAYRRMLDLYYRTQEPLSNDVSRVAKLIRLPDEIQVVDDILTEFFTLSDEGYRNARADREIEAYKRMASGGAKGAAKRWSKGSDSPPMPRPSPPQDNPNANHEPITNNQEPVEKRSPNGSRLPPDWVCPDEWIAFCRTERPDLDPEVTACRFADYWHGVAGAKGRKADWAATWRNWVRGERVMPKVVSPADVARVTTPARQGPDPALQKIIADQMKAVAPSADIRAKLAELRGKQ